VGKAVFWLPGRLASAFSFAAFAHSKALPSFRCRVYVLLRDDNRTVPHSPHNRESARSSLVQPSADVCAGTSVSHAYGASWPCAVAVLRSHHHRVGICQPRLPFHQTETAPTTKNGDRGNENHSSGGMVSDSGDVVFCKGSDFAAHEGVALPIRGRDHGLIAKVRAPTNFSPIGSGLTLALWGSGAGGLFELNDEQFAVGVPLAAGGGESLG
jgi:hypothetical protein